MTDMPIKMYAGRVTTWTRSGLQKQVLAWGMSPQSATSVPYVRADIADEMLTALELAWEALIYDPDYVDNHRVTTPAKAAVRAVLDKVKGP